MQKENKPQKKQENHGAPLLGKRNETGGKG